VFTTASQVAQDVLLAAAGVFEGIGEDWQPVEGSVSVGCLC
jgi:hypothetical protein